MIIQKITALKKISINQYINQIFVLYAFLIPVSRAGISILTALLFLLWFFSDDFKGKIQFIKSNKTITYLLLFISFSILSLLWSENVSSGIYYIRKYWYYFTILVIATSVNKKYLQYAISAFLAGMFISEVLSYGIFFELWKFRNVPVDFPTPFMNHIQYSTFLAFTSLLLLNRIFYVPNLKHKTFYFVYFLTVTSNLFLNAGRTGQAAFVFSIFVVAFLNFKNKFLSFFAILFFISVLLFTSYQISPLFKARVDIGLSDIKKITQDENYCTSLGLRAGAWINAGEIFLDYPVFGTGVNNDMTALIRNIDINHPEMECVKEMPSYHNYFVQTSVRLGFIGLFFYIMIYYSLIKLNIKDKQYYNMMIIFVSVYTLSSLVENVFHEQFTEAMFALFVGIFIAQNRIENEA